MSESPALQQHRIRVAAALVASRHIAMQLRVGYLLQGIQHSPNRDMPVQRENAQLFAWGFCARADAWQMFCARAGLDAEALIVSELARAKLAELEQQARADLQTHDRMLAILERRKIQTATPLTVEATAQGMLDQYAILTRERPRAQS